MKFPVWEFLLVHLCYHFRQFIQWFYVNCWGEKKDLTPILLSYLAFIPEVIFPFPRAADESPQASRFGGSFRPLLPQECQYYPRNDCLFFPLYPTRIFIFLYCFFYLNLLIRQNLNTMSVYKF